MTTPDGIKNFTFLLRGGTAEQWQSVNPILRNREPGIERNGQTSRVKIGDGETPWNSLPYIEGTGGGGGGGGYFKIEHPVAQVWVINHNLGYEPGGVFVTDSGGTEWLGEIEHNSVNQLTITFASAFGGVVRGS